MDVTSRWAMCDKKDKGNNLGELGSHSSLEVELRNADLKEKRSRVLESLRKSLTGHTVRLRKDFGEAKLKDILGGLTLYCDLNSVMEAKYKCVNSLKIYMNTKLGLMEVIKHEEALTLLSRTMDPSDTMTMLEAVRLLAAVCIVPPNGHTNALKGITVCGEIRNQERFVPIIMGLGMRDNQAMQVACIQLVNALVFTPEDLYVRLHLRNEFLRTGLKNLLVTLDNSNNNELQQQLHIFHDLTDEDYEALSNRLDIAGIDVEDAEKCFHIIHDSVKDTVAAPYFLSIMQRLLCIRDDLYARPNYYKLIDECVTQIVLHRSGTDPDFKPTRRYEIIEQLLNSLDEKLKDNEVSVRELSSKLETALTAKQESEAKVLMLEEKIKRYEEELANKEQIAHM